MRIAEQTAVWSGERCAGAHDAINSGPVRSEVPKGSLSTAKGDGRMYDLRLQWATEANKAKTYGKSKHVKLVFKTTR